MSRYHRRDTDPPRVAYEDHTKIPNWMMGIFKGLCILLLAYAAKTLHELDKGQDLTNLRLGRIERHLQLDPLTRATRRNPFDAHAATTDEGPP
jgi:hypothetical protein